MKKSTNLVIDEEEEHLVNGSEYSILEKSKKKLTLKPRAIKQIAKKTAKQRLGRKFQKKKMVRSNNSLSDDLLQIEEGVDEAINQSYALIVDNKKTLPPLQTAKKIHSRSILERNWPRAHNEYSTTLHEPTEHVKTMKTFTDEDSGIYISKQYRRKKDAGWGMMRVTEHHSSHIHVSYLLWHI
jgi:hypothetical protein